jgi:hypothetical protein
MSWQHWVIVGLSVFSILWNVGVSAQQREPAGSVSSVVFGILILWLLWSGQR